MLHSVVLKLAGPSVILVQEQAATATKLRADISTAAADAAASLAALHAANRELQASCLMLPVSSRDCRVIAALQGRHVL